MVAHSATIVALRATMISLLTKTTFLSEIIVFPWKTMIAVVCCFVVLRIQTKGVKQKYSNKKSAIIISLLTCPVVFVRRVTIIISRRKKHCFLTFFCLFLPFSAFFCLFRRKRMKKDEKG